MTLISVRCDKVSTDTRHSVYHTAQDLRYQRHKVCAWFVILSPLITRFFITYHTPDMTISSVQVTQWFVVHLHMTERYHATGPSIDPVGSPNKWMNRPHWSLLSPRCANPALPHPPCSPPEFLDCRHLFCVFCFAGPHLAASWTLTSASRTPPPGNLHSSTVRVYHTAQLLPTSGPLQLPLTPESKHSHSNYNHNHSTLATPKRDLVKSAGWQNCYRKFQFETISNDVYMLFFVCIT